MQWVSLTSIFLLTCQALISQTTLTPEQRRKLDSVSVQDVPARAPGIATAVIAGGKLVYEKYAGYADFGDSSLIHRKTRFNIASNGKQFTALAVLQLENQGKIRLTDDIRLYLPSLYRNLGDTITVGMLLNHTSGIRDCYDLWSLQGYTWWEQSFSNQDVLGLLERQTGLNFKPGTNYLYSNSNYILLALIIEKAAGKSFVDYTGQLFRELNMPNTSFVSDASRIAGPIARAYFNFSTWTTYEWIWNVCGDGNLFTTLEDQIQWEKIVQGQKVREVPYSVIAQSQQPIEGSRFRNYGYGLEFGQYKGADYVFHEGATGAWKATVMRFPGRQTSFITLTNTGKSIPAMQTRQMADILFSLKADAAYWVTQPAATDSLITEEEVVGVYLTEDDFAFQFEKREGKLFLKRIGRNDVELERESANIFHQKFDPAFKQEFTRNASGALQVTAYYTSHAPYTLTKQPDDFSGYSFRNLNGRYRNEETGTVFEIAYKEGNVYLLTFGNKESVQGIMVTPGKLLVNNYTLIATPANSSQQGLLLSGNRIRNVEFARVH